MRKTKPSKCECGDWLMYTDGKSRFLVAEEVPDEEVKHITALPHQCLAWKFCHEHQALCYKNGAEHVEIPEAHKDWASRNIIEDRR